MPRWGGGAPKCGRCKKSVYKAEEKLGGGQSWHPRCFTCSICNMSLDSTTLADKRSEQEDGDVRSLLYCKKCYSKEFGPKGYGYGAGAGTLSMDAGSRGWGTENIPAAPTKNRAAPLDESTRCGRCSSAVFLPEQVLYGGTCWHNTCFSCFICSKHLDSVSATEKDQQLYCRFCYRKNFGPKGIGFEPGSRPLPYK